MHPTHNPSVDVTAVVDSTPADVLRGAALYLRRHGFHQGDMFASLTTLTPPACAQGAVKMAICGSPHATYTLDQAGLFDQTMTVLAEHAGMPYDWDAHRLPDTEPVAPAEWVADWNDDPDRTVEQVITAMTTAADDWDHITVVTAALAAYLDHDPAGDCTQDGGR